MTANVEQIIAVAARTVGPCRAVADLSWAHGESVVVELEADDGERFVGKAHRKTASFTAEHRAYQRWVPALGSAAPSLVWSDADLQVVILTKLAGSRVGDEDALSPDVHRQAGALLARFHGSEEPVLLDGFARSLRARFTAWVGRAEPRVLDPADVAFVDRQLSIIDAMPDPLGVPCHRDWQPRNWIIDGSGTVGAIDFEHSRAAPWYEDLHRLWWREWTDAPHLADAFFAGYGRTMDADELRSFLALSRLGHLVAIVWAHEHHDDAFGAHARRCLAAARNELP